MVTKYDHIHRSIYFNCLLQILIKLQICKNSVSVIFRGVNDKTIAWTLSEQKVFQSKFLKLISLLSVEIVYFNMFLYFCFITSK